MVWNIPVKQAFNMWENVPPYDLFYSASIRRHRQVTILWETKATTISQMWALITVLPALAYSRFFSILGNLLVSLATKKGNLPYTETVHLKVSWTWQISTRATQTNRVVRTKQTVKGKLSSWDYFIHSEGDILWPVLPPSRRGVVDEWLTPRTSDLEVLVRF